MRSGQRHQQLWRALITGPAETPYSGGCFVGDPGYDGYDVRFALCCVPKDAAVPPPPSLHVTSHVTTTHPASPPGELWKIAEKT